MPEQFDLSTLQMLTMNNAVAVEAIANVLIKKELCTARELKDEAAEIKRGMAKRDKEKDKKKST